VGIVRSAELTGKLDESLESLGDYMQREIETRSKLVASLTYPLVVLVLAMGTVVLLAGFVLPRFKPLFEELNADLPMATRLMLGTSNVFTEYWFIPVGLIVGFVTLVLWMFKTDGGRPTRDRVLLKIPIVRHLVACALLERFCRMLGAMVSAGVPLIDGFRTTTQGTDNIVYRQKFDQVQTAMLEGAGFARPLAATGLFPGAARQMFKVGEETGTLDKQLSVAAGYFGRELEDRMRRFTAMFEPLLIIFIGLVVGFVAVALVQAMYGMLGDMNQGM
jgi:type IV pilus assembly protein PilC